MSESKKQIWLLRHAATDWSTNGRHTGVTDLPLLSGGRHDPADRDEIDPVLQKICRNLRSCLNQP